MAIYHLSAQYISHTSGRSAVAAAAYRSGEKLRESEEVGKLHAERIPRRAARLEKLLGEIEAVRAELEALPEGHKGRDRLHVKLQRLEKEQKNHTRGLKRDTQLAAATEIVFDYRRKHGVSHTEIMTPEYAPAWVHDREKLWNAMELVEKRINSQPAREINIALPRELSPQENIRLARGFVQEQLVNRGMVADLCFHELHGSNPHLHIMQPTRQCDAQGFTDKNRDWDKKELLREWRKAWAQHCNQALQSSGSAARVDHRSYETLGIDRAPGVHIGVTGSAIMRRGLHQADRAMAHVEARFKSAFGRAITTGRLNQGKAKRQDDFITRYYFGQQLNDPQRPSRGNARAPLAGRTLHASRSR